MADQETKLDAAEALNWEYLIQFGENDPGFFKSHKGLRQFAYDFTSNGNTAEQNSMLTELLKNATFGHSDGTNEETLKYVAKTLNSDLEKLRIFAKQRGIRLKKKT